MNKQTQVERIRWLPAKNVGGDQIPAFGVVCIDTTGVDTTDGSFKVKKPTTDSQDCFVCGFGPINAGDDGAITADFPCLALYDTSDGTPSVDDVLGAASGGYKLRTGKTGFVVKGVVDSTNGVAMVTKQTSGGGGSAFTPSGIIAGWTWGSNIMVGSTGVPNGSSSIDTYGPNTFTLASDHIEMPVNGLYLIILNFLSHYSAWSHPPTLGELQANITGGSVLVTQSIEVVSTIGANPNGFGSCSIPLRLGAGAHISLSITNLTDQTAEIGGFGASLSITQLA